MRGRSRQVRRRASAWSDHLRLVTIVHPLAFAAVVPIARGPGWDGVDAAWLLEMMNLQGFAVNAVFQRLSHQVVGRRRPAKLGCRDDPGYHPNCGTSWMNESFFGGHVSVAFTGAGLACAHHLEGELLGDQLADSVACLLSLGAAGGVAMARQVSEAHWMSDDVVGAAVGLGAGFVLPTVLHYHPPWRSRTSGGRAPDSNREVGFSLFPLGLRARRFRMAVVPGPSGVGVVGRF